MEIKTDFCQRWMMMMMKKRNKKEQRNRQKEDKTKRILIAETKRKEKCLKIVTK